MQRIPLLLALLSAACAPLGARTQESPPAATPDPVVLTLPIERSLEAGEHALPLEVEVPVAGRYRTELHCTTPGGASLWVEDHVGNPDDRTYDITGPIEAPAAERRALHARDGSPLDAGTHTMLVHVAGPGCTLHEVRFVLLREHRETPRVLTQSMEGEDWALVWSDEFDGEGLPDPETWTHDLGDWGWGNREPQYYTEGRTRNARQEDGVLVIEAHPDDMGRPWTSARLTTRGKLSFLYGRIVIRARVPALDGTWAAGWTLGDAYRDELSWPYCGEIDICEAVGREIDDESGDGLNHASCHTRAFYFKQGNHISNVIEVPAMAREFHDYVCEWDTDEVRMYVDGRHYYTYDKTADALEWPFDRPQNLILNLAMGGGMGGPIAAEAGPQRFEIDHVRVYERR